MAGPSKFADAAGRILVGVSIAAQLCLIPLLFVAALVPVIARWINAEWATRAGAAGSLQAPLFFGIVMLSLGLIFLRDGHVRIDLFRRHQSPATQRWVDLAGGALVLLPFCGALLWFGTRFAAEAFRLGEFSDATLDFPLIWLVKGIIPLGGALLLIAGAVVAARSAAPRAPTSEALSRRRRRSALLAGALVLVAFGAPWLLRPAQLPVLMLLALGAGLLSGYPVALVLVGAGLAFGLVGMHFGLVTLGAFGLVQLRFYGFLAEDENIFYTAVPALLFVGAVLERSGIARELLTAMAKLIRRVPGSLPIAVTVLGVILAPAAGLVGASVTTLAMIALPTLLEAGYPVPFATGTVAAAGTLGIAAPPAVMLFFLALTFRMELPVLFLGMVGPLFVLFVLYACYQMTVAWRLGIGRPGPPGAPEASWAAFARSIGQDLVLPLALFAAVFAALIFGWATPLECATLGALGSLAIAALHGDLNARFLREAILQTANGTGMIFFIVIGAAVFSVVFSLLNGPAEVFALIQSIGGGQWGPLLTIMGIVFCLGFLIDWLEILLIFFPIFLPVLRTLDFSSFAGSPALAFAWITVLFTLNLQSSFLTPPFGFSLFFIKAWSPPSTTMPQIYKGIAVYVLFQVLAIGLVLLFPMLATALPDAWLRSR